MAKRKTKKKASRPGKNLFSVAAKNKSYKSAKKALAKAQTRAKKAYKAAIVKAKKTLRSKRRK